MTKLDRNFRLKQTLIIWEFIPDKMMLFLVPNSVVTQEQREKLVRANGNYINVHKNKDVEWLHDALEEDGIWHQYLYALPREDAVAKSFDGITITHVYTSGFVL